MFIRSDWGITNRARFTGARYTVYVEGGGGNSGQGSDDVIFWKAVFARLRPDLAITLKAFGGKPQLETIARKVALGQIKNTIVAMDSDFDELLGEKIKAPNVIYSYGYSWENDVLTLSNVEIALERLIKADSVPVHIWAEVDRIYRGCLKKLLKFINVDLYLRGLKSSLFPRVSSGRFIGQISQTCEPTIDIGPLRSCCIQTILAIPRSERTSRPVVSILDPQGHLQGHTLMFLVRKVMFYGIKLSGRNLNLTEDLLVQTVIPAFSDYGLMSDKFLRAHYTSMFAALQ